MPDAETQGRDLVVQLRGGGLQYIHQTHRAFDALHFVLLFPKGDDGWQIGACKKMVLDSRSARVITMHIGCSGESTTTAGTRS